MKKPSDTDWDEFKDVEIVDWKRARAAMEHENMLINERVNWLLIGQGFLLAAYFTIFDSIITREEVPLQKLPYALGSLSIISLTGIALAIFLSRGVKAAFEQHDHIRSWWYRQIAETDTRRHPNIAGTDPRFGKTIIHYYDLPWVFVPIWMLLQVLTIIQYTQRIEPGSFVFPLMIGIFAISGCALGVIIYQRIYPRGQRGRNQKRSKV